MKFDPVKTEAQVRKVVNTVATVLITFGGLLGFDFLSAETVQAIADGSMQILGQALALIGAGIIFVKELIARFRKDPEEEKIAQIVRRELAAKNKAA